MVVLFLYAFVSNNMYTILFEVQFTTALYMKNEVSYYSSAAQVNTTSIQRHTNSALVKLSANMNWVLVTN
jgi:hypothetical protein